MRHHNSLIGDQGLLDPTNDNLDHGVLPYLETRKRSKDKRTDKEKTLPALAFVRPYNEMLMLGLLNIDEFGVKTRSRNLNYKGPVLLYTSNGRPHQIPAQAHGLNLSEVPAGAIVGVATMVDSRELVWEERVKATQNFNNWGRRQAEDNLCIMNLYGKTQDDCILPLTFGVFMKNIKRFKEPVQFKPKHGAIGIMRVPLGQVSKALKEVGINPKSL